MSIKSKKVDKEIDIFLQFLKAYHVYNEITEKRVHFFLIISSKFSDIYKKQVIEL